MTDQPKWMPSDEEIVERAAREIERETLHYCPRGPIRTAVERALAEQERKVRRATLQEAARVVCERCAVETPALGDDGSYWHSPGNYGSTWCDASPIYDLIAALDKEGEHE